MNTRSQRSKRSRANDDPRGSSKVVLPPVITAPGVNKSLIRYVSSGAINAYGVSGGDLIASCGNICFAANSAMNSIASSIRIKYVDIYPSANGVTGTEERSYFAWIMQKSNPDLSQVMDVPDGVTNTARCRFTPPAGSLASFWINNNQATDAIFNLTLPQGSVVDVCMEYTRCGSYGSVTSAVATATLGTFYYTYLDRSAHLLAPQGLPRTF
jgi:hypothetical protein